MGHILGTLVRVIGGFEHAIEGTQAHIGLNNEKVFRLMVSLMRARRFSLMKNSH